MSTLIALAGAPGTGVEGLRDALARRVAQTGMALQPVDVTPQLLAGVPLPGADVPLCCLLMGLDALAGPARRAADAADLQLRHSLDAAGWPYGVVYGRGERRVESAWRLLSARWPGIEARTPDAVSAPSARLRPCCPECLVPECEHRLFRFASKG